MNNFLNEEISTPVRTGADPSEPVHTGANLNAKWLSVKDSINYLMSKGLKRSEKTIRKWCASDGFDEIRKELTPNGFKWMISEEALDIYFIEEKALEAQSSEQVHTGADLFEPVPTGADRSEPVQTDKNDSEEVDKLKAQIEEKDKEIMDLTIEKKVAYRIKDHLQTTVDIQAEVIQVTERLLGRAEAQVESLGGSPMPALKVGEKTYEEPIRDEYREAEEPEIRPIENDNPVRQSYTTEPRREQNGYTHMTYSQPRG